MTLRSAFLSAILLFLALSPALAWNLEFQFIGNEAFHISDGKTTLLSDFPYKSGAFGYMTYEMKNIKPIVDGVVLITHKHEDHWDPKLFSSMNLWIIAPPEILPEVNTKKKIQFANEMHYKDITILAFRTPHTPQHHSYLVIWHGIRIYFPGDTEITEPMEKMKDLDVAFITPWLLTSFMKIGKTIEAKRLVVYHHQKDENVPEYQKRIVPKQMDSFVVPF